MHHHGQINPPLQTININYYVPHTPKRKKKEKDRENSNNKMPKHTVTSLGDSAQCIPDWIKERVC